MSNKFLPVASASTSRANLVEVSSESDFPAPSGGAITLADDVQYLILADISTANRFILGNNMVLCAPDSSIVTLTYTGTGAMFTSTAGKVNKVSSISLSCASGDLLDITGVGAASELFQLTNVTVVSCDKLGTINAMGNVRIGSVNLVSITTDGLTFTGANGTFFFQEGLTILAAGSVFNLGVATFANAFSVINSSVTVAAGSFCISGATGSANIGAGGLGTFLNTRLSGAGSFASGITSSDALWAFGFNDDIADTRPSGLLSFGTPTTTTATVNTPTLIVGTWVVEKTSQFTGTAAGRLTWNGVSDVDISVDITTTIQSVSGSNKDITIYVALNGTEVANSAVTNQVSSNDPKNTVVFWDFTLSPNDFIEVFVENNTDGIGLVTDKATMRIS